MGMFSPQFNSILLTITESFGPHRGIVDTYTLQLS